MDPTANRSGLSRPSERQTSITRMFDAPRDEVFRKTFDRYLIPQWWGPRRLTTVVDKMDVRPGGEWRFIQHDEQGKEYAFHGAYQEVDGPNRAEYTFVYEGMPNDVMVERVVFDEVDGKTLVTITDLFPSQESRDAALRAGMEEGAVESMERFAELLARTA
jgi:uncharacterized protein YndB with AHSA1/START domain